MHHPRRHGYWRSRFERAAAQRDKARAELASLRLQLEQASASDGGWLAAFVRRLMGRG